MNQENTELSKKSNQGDERLIAVLCHALGMLVIPLLVYLLKKDESPYLGAQAKQALAWQAACTVVFTAGSFLIGALATVTFGLGGLLYLAIPPLGLVAFCWGLYAAYQAWLGVYYRYPLIQPLVAQL